MTNKHIPSFFNLGLLALTLFSFQKVKAQELIHNGGFEILKPSTSPPPGGGYWFKCEGWDEIDWIIDQFNPKPKGTADYYIDSVVWNLDTLKVLNKCDISTFKGTATMGLVSFQLSPDRPNEREYIATKLLTPLEVGGYYEISLWVSNCHNLPVTGYYNYPGLSCSGLGIALTSTKFATEGLSLIDFIPQILVSEEIWTNEWKKYNFKFLADSAYNYLTLGFILNDSEISYTDHQPDQSSMTGYYFIDEVSMYRLPNIYGDTVICEGETAVLKAWNEDSLYLWAEASNPNIIVCSTRTLSVFPDTTTTYILNPGSKQMSVVSQFEK